MSTLRFRDHVTTIQNKIQLYPKHLKKGCPSVRGSAACIGNNLKGMEDFVLKMAQAKARIWP